MTTLTRSDRAALEHLRAHSSLPVVSRIAVQVAWCVLLWSQRRKSRRDLSLLDDHMLNDIGLSPRQAEQEYSKWFWRP